MPRLHLRAALGAAAALVLVHGLPAHAMSHGDAAEFFQDQRVTVVVPSGSGGTYHVYCQIVQRNLGRHLPGEQEMLIQNRPGAGGVKAANYMANAAPKDGTVVAMINPGSVMIPLLRKGDSNIKFDTREFNWLGTVSVRTYTGAVWHTVPVESVDDLKTRETIFGATGKGATTYLVPTFVKDVLGAKIKVITGYKGGGALNLAMERGEIEGRTNYYSGYTGVRPGWIKNNKIRFLWWMGPSRPEIEKRDVPHLSEFVETDRQRDMLNLLEVSFNVGQSFYVPPGVPKARVDVLREAFAAMLEDPKTHADAEKSRVPMNTQTWRQIEDYVAGGWRSSPEAAEALAKVMGFR